MKNIRYLCNMKTKNLYSNTIWEPMLIALASTKKYPPQLSYRSKILTALLSIPVDVIIVKACTGTLSLLANAFSGRDFYVNLETRKL